MQGEGLGDIIQSGMDAMKNVFAPRNDYNAAKATLRKYGDYRIVKVWVYRKPIDAMLNAVLNFVSLGQFDDAKKDARYDKLFHLGAFLMLNDGAGKFMNVICEKNEVMDLKRVSINIAGYGEKPSRARPAADSGVQLTAFLANAHKELGDKCFK